MSDTESDHSQGLITFEHLGGVLTEVFWTPDLLEVYPTAGDRQPLLAQIDEDITNIQVPSRFHYFSDSSKYEIEWRLDYEKGTPTVIVNTFSHYVLMEVDGKVWPPELQAELEALDEMTELPEPPPEPTDINDQ